MQFWNLKKKYKRRDRIEKLPDVHTEISVNIRELFVANKQRLQVIFTYQDLPGHLPEHPQQSQLLHLHSRIHRVHC